MRVKSTPVSSLKQESPPFSGTRTRKKHKRLDAICEDTYNRNHAETSKGDIEDGAVGDDAELRRSSRVRRAPVILDASPPPPRKRQKIKDVEGSTEKSTKLISPRVKEIGVESSEDVEILGSWKSRLRSKRKYVRFGKKHNYDGESPRWKRKLFVETDREGNEEKKLETSPTEEKVKVVGKTMELDFGSSVVRKSRRCGRGKSANPVWEEKKQDGSDSEKEHNILHNDIDDTREDDRETIPAESETSDQNENAVTSDDAVEVVEEEVKKVDGAVHIDEDSLTNDVTVPTEQTEDIGGRVEVVTEEIPEKSDELVAEEPANQLEETSHDGKDMNLVQLNEKPMENGDIPTKDASTHHSRESFPLSGIKGGRRCGLCGGGNDGKPPKKLVLDMVESDNEACNGSSASEEPRYDTLDGFGDEIGWLGRLLGPINDRYGIAGIWVHQHCAVWSPEVYFAGLGCLKNVRAALCRGRALKCSRCGRPGATIGCRVDRCPKTYHLPCARAMGCIFDHWKFLIACTDHRHIFQPHSNKSSIYMKRLKIKKLKQKYRKISNEACRKDIEAEEKWLENCGEDEEFLKRESKRLHRDLLRISPVYIGGTESGSGQHFQGWESVAGLQDVIRCMKEVVILPLLYPNFFDNLGITPPRGILLHGYPGTGKTLVVRALIGSIARGDKRIAYFARKGADCLGKYVGDAERQLRLLFQVAEKCQPSIIFFDEIDGLAPVRTKQQDQTHSSVVSTLLALLDGLKSRGSVVVIGATNRPDAVDPALRRPGRFDREIYFPLPSLEDRAAILSLHTQKWPKPVSEPLLGWLARKTAGFAGADLQALCTQAAMVALKRNFPLHEVLSAAGKNSHGSDRTPLPSFAVEERDWLEALSRSPPPCSRREAGIAANDILSSPLPVHLIPCLLHPLSNLLVSLSLDERLCLPPSLSRAAAGVANVIYSALDRRKLARDQWRFHIDSFMQEANVSKEIERELSSAGILSGQLNCNSFSDNECTESDYSLSYNFSTHAGSLRNLTFALRNEAGYRLLISGSPGSGQKHLASCILHCYIGNVEVQKVDLATVSQEGHGDMLQGISRILMKCANAGSSVVFMPRIDLWAMETKHQDINDDSNHPSSDHHCLDERVTCPAESQAYKMDIEPFIQQLHSEGTNNSEDDCMSASHMWNSFFEQVESICVNTSLVIVATSEIPFEAFPHRITQFFSSNKLDGGQHAHLESALPRFSVDIDVDINCGLVIDQSAAKISRDLIQQFVQLIHQRAHSPICKESLASTVNCTSITNDIVKHGLPNEQAPGKQCPDDNVVKTSAVSSKKNMKGKSSLMQAILTFGYQILQYPHFAELCWVTSKLKEGPVADINGPWKSWPFNSCIVRPHRMAEKTSGTCSPPNIKSKEKTGLVRGLVAVGLSAYRGLYSSATEVSLQIRWVLELLVQQINERIQAGKDQYQYVRILSQVSYLEDMVNSWAYSLRSLEVDAQVTSTRVLTNAASSPDSHALPDPHNPLSSRIHDLQAPGTASTDVEVPEGNCPVFSVKNTESAELRKNITQCDQNGPSQDIALTEDSPEKASLLTGPENPHHSINANKLAGKTSMECDVANVTCELDTAVNSGVMYEKSGISSQSSGSALSNSAILDSQLSGLQSRNTDINGVPTPDRNSTCKSAFTNVDSAASNSDFVCSYLCCSKCLHSLHEVLRKLLIHAWGLNMSLSVEDVHDAVVSLSVDLVSTLRRGYFSDNTGEISGEEQCLSIDSLNLLTCHCKKFYSSLTSAAECTSHSVGGSTNMDGDGSQNSGFGLNVEFILRNGVLTTVAFEKDVAFHCKYKNLCLHPLLELVKNRSSI